jgi:hypothetical protein
MLTAADIMRDAGVILLDEDHVRWPLIELAGWLDEAVAAIITAKPNTAPVVEELTLAKGTRQQLTDDPAIVRLLDVPRNLDVSRPGAGGRMIRPTTRANLDSVQPRWHDPAYVPFRREVRQVVFDDMNLLGFSVYPGNDGSGKVEILIARLPKRLLERHEGDATDIETWKLPFGIPENNRSAILEYLLYRCFMKDDTAASIQRSSGHYQVFASTVGIKVQVEKANGPNRKQ